MCKLLVAGLKYNYDYTRISLSENIFLFDNKDKHLSFIYSTFFYFHKIHNIKNKHTNKQTNKKAYGGIDCKANKACL